MRYWVTPPTPGGYNWWNVCDSQSSEYWGQNNFAIATIFAHLPNAERHARELCAALNAA